MRHYIFILALVLSALLIAGCQQSSDESTPEPTAAPTEDVTETEATEVVTPEVEESTPDVEADAETEEPAATPEPTPLTNESVSEGGEYYIAVSYTTDVEEDPANAPPEGQRWIIVVATLANQEGATVMVDAEDLTLTDTEGNTYMPEPPDDDTQPPMVGAELAEGDEVLGLARFAIPTDATLDELVWCPGGTCEAPIRSNIP